MNEEKIRVDKLRCKHLLGFLYESVGRNWRKMVEKEIIILVLLLILVISFNSPWTTLLKGLSSHIGFKPAWRLVGCIALIIDFSLVYSIVKNAQKVSRYLMDNYVGRIRSIGTDIVLMANLFFFISFCGVFFDDLSQMWFLVLILVIRFWYNLRKIIVWRSVFSLRKPCGSLAE